jgi:tetratricopeptide (TPR) repeat protein
VEQAEAAFKAGDPAEALRLQQKALEWVQAHRGPVDPFRALVLNNLSVILSALGRCQEALAPTEEAVKIWRELAKSNGAYLGDLALALNNLGVRYSELGRRQEALAPTEEAVKIGAS